MYQAVRLTFEGAMSHSSIQAVTFWILTIYIVISTDLLEALNNFARVVPMTISAAGSNPHEELLLKIFDISYPVARPIKMYDYCSCPSKADVTMLRWVIE